RPLPPGVTPTYLEANLGLEDVDLAELIKRLGFKLPVDLAGRLTFQVNVAVPVNAPREFKAYRLKGSASLSRLRVAGVDLAAVKAELNYDNGLLRLDKLSGQVPWPGNARHKPGRFAGSGRVQVFPQGDLAADLTVDQFPLAVLPGGLGKGGLSG